MTHIALGSKCKCLTCATLFFDLQRDPILCPKCGEVFTPQALPHSVSYRPRARLPAAPDATVQSEENEASEESEADAEPAGDSEDALEAEEADAPAEPEADLLDPDADGDADL